MEDEEALRMAILDQKFKWFMFKLVIVGNILFWSYEFLWDYILNWVLI